MSTAKSKQNLHRSIHNAIRQIERLQAYADYDYKFDYKFNSIFGCDGISYRQWFFIPFFFLLDLE